MDAPGVLIFAEPRCIDAGVANQDNETLPLLRALT